MATFDGQGDSLITVVVPGDTLAGTTTIRFHFQSDGDWSDEDGLYDSEGAFIIDSLTVSDATGVLDFQDFEMESPGAVSTLDGDWSANVGPEFGDYAGLFDGTTVLQEDPATDDTYLWGFFNGSPDNYGCGGFPGQAAVPFTMNMGSTDMGDYLNNEIWSPLLRLDEDTDGMPVPPTGSVTLEFDIYTDLPLDNLVFFEWRVRSITEGALGEWRNAFAYYDADKLWKRARFELFPFIDAGASHIQVAIGAVDLCYKLCGILGSGSCHSHGPLIDNITITARETAGYTVTNTADAGPGSLREALLAANGSEDRNRILFNIPGPGPHTITPETPLPLIVWPVAIDATTQPGYAGVPVVAISGDSAGTFVGLRLDATKSAIAGLAIHDFAGVGVHVSNSNDTIRGSYIGLTPAAGAASNSGHGVYIESPFGSYVEGTVVGGTGSEDANIIAFNGGVGAFVDYSAIRGNTIRGNSIHSNVGRGIDLSGSANDQQRYPVLDHAVAPLSVEGSLTSKANTDFVIDFYANTACDASGFGEGERLVGTIQVATDGGGYAFFSTTVSDTLALGEEVTATATNTDGSTSEFSACVTVSAEPTAIPEDASIPVYAALFQNVPNPFNPITVIRYDIPAGGAKVWLTVYDVLGRRVRTLVDGPESAGEKSIEWNGRNDRGELVATGVYFLRMQAGDFSQTRKLVVLR